MPKFVPAPRDELIARGIIQEDAAEAQTADAQNSADAVEEAAAAPEAPPVAKKAPPRRPAAKKE